MARAALAEALRNATYEILPFTNAEETVLAHVPKDVGLTVTTTEAKGLGPTVDLAARLVRHGYRTAPHLAARLVRDKAHLSDIVAQLRENNVESVFIIGGDAPEPAGEFPDALSLLEALDNLNHTFASVGIVLPGRPRDDRRRADRARPGGQGAARDPDHHATVLQRRDDARWAREVHSRGVDLPIRVGIPGAISRQKLIRVSAGLGLGQSARFLKKQQSMFWRFFLPGGYRPDKLVERLTPAFAQSDNELHGFHIFTFNDLASTEAWRQTRLTQPHWHAV